MSMKSESRSNFPSRDRLPEVEKVGELQISGIETDRKSMETRTVNNGSRVRHLNQMTTHDDDVGKFCKFDAALISSCKKRKQILHLQRRQFQVAKRGSGFCTCSMMELSTTHEEHRHATTSQQKNISAGEYKSGYVK